MINSFFINSSPQMKKLQSGIKQKSLVKGFERWEIDKFIVKHKAENSDNYVGQKSDFASKRKKRRIKAKK